MVRLVKNRLFLKILFCILALSLSASVLTGFAAYRVSSRSMIEKTYNIVGTVMDQTRRYLDDKLETVSLQMKVLESNPAFLRMVIKEYKDGMNSYYLDISNVVGTFHKACENYDVLIDSIYFYDNRNELELYSTQNMGIRQINGKGYGWDYLEGYHSSDSYWLNYHEDWLFLTGESRPVFTILKKMGTAGSPVAYMLMMNLRPALIIDALDEADLGEHGYFALMSADGMYLAEGFEPHAAVDRQELEGHLLSAVDGQWETLKAVNGEAIRVSHTTLQNGWILMAILPEDDILSQARAIASSTVLIVFIISILCTVLSIFLTRSVTRPIASLAQGMKELEQGNLDIQLHINASDEVKVLETGLNSLIKRIKILLHEVAETEKQKRIRELSTMQAQINPHFLYNTLSSVRVLTSRGQIQESELMIDSLICFFRTGLSKGRSSVRLHEELAHVRSYLDIQKIRYQNRFEYEIEAGEELLDSLILKLTIQPLVENSLYHGLKDADGGGLILIAANRQGEDFIITVFDNGCGIERGQIDLIEKAISQPFQDDEELNPSFGLRNVHQRIFLRYGNGYGISIKSVEEEYTQVILRLPYRQWQSKEKEL